MTGTGSVDPGAEWLRRQGHRVVEGGGAVWYDAAPRFFQAFPPHPPINPSEAELSRIIRKSNALGLRYSVPLSAPLGQLSYHVVCDRRDYGLEHLSRQTRQNIRKGLEYADYGPISFDQLAEEGWRLRLESLVRQSRISAENESWWKRLCRTAEGLKGFEAWGALRGGRLVASLFAYLDKGRFLMLYQQSLTDHLRFGVNNTLAYVFTQRSLARPDVQELFYGFQSLDAGSNVDEFKFRMGFRAEPVRQKIVFHPALCPLVRPATLTVVDFLCRLGIGGPRLLKAAGLIRFYLNGRRPAESQVLPECLRDRSDELLEKASCGINLSGHAAGTASKTRARPKG